MNSSRALALIGVAAALSAGASSAQAASWLTVGPSDLCGASGCFGASKTFTQTFSASGHNGVVDISSLTLMRDLMGGSSNAVRISFLLSDGTEVSWGKYTLAALGSNVITVGGQQVAWDTSLGDLTVKLDLVVPDKGGVGGGGFGGGGFGGGGGSVDVGGGLGGGVASGGGAPFDYGGITQGGPLVRPALPPQSAVAVPEPAAWALMILGFGAAGSMIRRRKSDQLRHA